VCVCVCVVSHPCSWRGSFTCVTWLIHIGDVTHSCVRHNSFMCVTWHNSFTCVTCHNSFVCVSYGWLNHIFPLTHSCVCRDSSISFSCGKTRSYVLCYSFTWNYSFICVTWLEPFMGETRFFHMCVTHAHHTHIFSFAEHSLFHRALLQKRPIILRSLIIVSTP